MSSSTAGPALLAVLECPICLNIYDGAAHKPLVLSPCGHSLCDTCRAQLSAVAQRFKCPECRQKVATTSVSYTMQKMGTMLLASLETTPPSVQGTGGVSRCGTVSQPPLPLSPSRRLQGVSEVLECVYGELVRVAAFGRGVSEVLECVYGVVVRLVLLGFVLSWAGPYVYRLPPKVADAVSFVGDWIIQGLWCFMIMDLLLGVVCIALLMGGLAYLMVRIAYWTVVWGAGEVLLLGGQVISWSLDLAVSYGRRLYAPMTGYA